MSNSYAISMTRPHEALGLPKPLGRRLPQGLVGWNMFLAVLTMVCGMVYIVQVNASTSKGYELSQAEKRVDSLKVETLSLQNKAATLTSLQQLSARAAELGLKPVDGIDFVNPAAKNYALAK
ncbi:hypothetical protein HZC53_06010 [Candidatus Uhrbacteria bacterium]|nr:hypothetical protein [Candidatus Uhrbacteria bacterium]